MKDTIVTLDDHEEVRLVKNVLTVLGGVSAETAINVLVRVLEPVLVGSAKDKEQALQFVERVSKHLADQVDSKAPDQFGFLSKPDDDGPIIYDDIKKDVT
jgi:hypothetical protein